MSIDHQSPLITENLSTSMVDESEDQSFAEMFAEQEQSESKSSKLAPGQKVTVRIVAITPDTVFVSTGSKVDGIVDREELEVDGALPYQVDDMVELFVVTVSPQEVKLSKIIRGAGGITALEDAYTAGLPVEGKILGQIKGGYAVEVLKRRAFCPISQIDLHPLDDPESVIGKVFPFAITRLEKGGRNIVLSRRVLLEKEQAENIEKVIETLNINDVIEVVIKRMVPYGVFVEIAPGVEGLVHISELSWARLGQPDEAFSLGDMIRVKVLSINRNEKGTKFSLSAKAVTEDPWKSLAGRVAEGDVLNGKVVRTAPFGAFVEIFPGIEGLVHLSEFSFEKRVMKAEEMVVVGDHVFVKIKEIDPDKKRVSLSMRDVAGDPWNTVSEILTVDSELIGTVEKRSLFGLFITLAPGITGLLPSSIIQASKNRKNLERLGLGDSINVVIKKIDVQQHRVSLAPAGEDIAIDNSKEEKNWKEHVTAKKEIKPSVGSLGMALQAALSKKKK